MSSSSTTASITTFQYLLIPADSSKPIEIKTGDTSGGLTNDVLVQSARDYFFAQSGGNAAKQEVFDPSPSCEIMALTIPTRSNNYQAVSMYVGEHNTSSSQMNARACDLLQACGHRLPETSSQHRQPGVYGDVFVGRCYDDEGKDIWRRVDFVEHDLNPESDWIQIAKREGSSSTNVASLSGMLNQFKSNSLPSSSSQENVLPGYVWDQTEDEVELRFTVKASVTAKQVQIKFSHASLKVCVAGETLLEGNTGGSVVVDESTYTLQPDGKDEKELCVVLTKRDEGQTWARAIQTS